MAKKVALFIADGTEETEAITPADLLRRAGIDVDIVSVMDRPDITASRGVRITADKVIAIVAGLRVWGNRAAISFMTGEPVR